MGKHWWLPRFSLRTLILLACLAGASFGLWWHWEPWVETGVRVATEDDTKVVLFSPDGTRIARYVEKPEKKPGEIFSFGINKYEIIDAQSGRSIADLSGGFDNTGFGGGAEVRLSPLGEWLHAKSHDNIVHWEGVWRMSDGEPALDFDISDHYTVCYSQGGKFLAVRGYGGPTSGPKIVDTKTGKTVQTGIATGTMAFSGDDTLAATHANKFEIALYETKTWTKIHSIFHEFPNEFRLMGTALDPSGNLMIVSSYTGQSLAFDTKTGKVLFPVGGYIPIVDGFGFQFYERMYPGFQSNYFSPEGKNFCVFGRSDSLAWIWSAKDGSSVLISCEGSPLKYSAFAFSRDAKRLLVCDPGTSLNVWNSESGEKIWGRKGRFTCSPDAEVVIEGGDGYFALLNAADGTEIYRSPPLGTRIQFGYLSADKRRLVLADDKGLAVWERRRPETWWGLLQFLEFWLVMVLAPAVLWSLFRDRRTLIASGAGK